MKIDIRNKNPYDAVIDVIRELTKEDGHECMFERLVRIRTTVLGESNEYLGVNDTDYYWNNDWYEGGDVEMLGFVDIEDIDIPNNVDAFWEIEDDE